MRKNDKRLIVLARSSCYGEVAKVYVWMLMPLVMVLLLVTFLWLWQRVRAQSLAANSAQGLRADTRAEHCHSHKIVFGQCMTCAAQTILP